jgi:hypothetical protein
MLLGELEMNNWDDISDEDLYTLHDILGLSAKAKDSETFSEKLDNFDRLHNLLKEISIEFIINISNKLSKIIHSRAKKSVETKKTLK